MKGFTTYLAIQSSDAVALKALLTESTINDPIYCGMPAVYWSIKAGSFACFSVCVEMGATLHTWIRVALVLARTEMVQMILCKTDIAVLKADLEWSRTVPRLLESDIADELCTLRI